MINDQLPATKFDPCGESERRVFAELVSILEGDRAIAQAVPGYEKEVELSLTQLKVHAASKFSFFIFTVIISELIFL